MSKRLVLFLYLQQKESRQQNRTSSLPPIGREQKNKKHTSSPSGNSSGGSNRSSASLPECGSSPSLVSQPDKQSHKDVNTIPIKEIEKKREKKEKRKKENVEDTVTNNHPPKGVVLAPIVKDSPKPKKKKKPRSVSESSREQPMEEERTQPIRQNEKETKSEKDIVKEHKMEKKREQQNEQKNVQKTHQKNKQKVQPVTKTVNSGHNDLSNEQPMIVDENQQPKPEKKHNKLKKKTMSHEKEKREDIQKEHVEMQDSVQEVVVPPVTNTPTRNTERKRDKPHKAKSAKKDKCKEGREAELMDLDEPPPTNDKVIEPVSDAVNAVPNETAEKTKRKKQAKVNDPVPSDNDTTSLEEERNTTMDYSPTSINDSEEIQEQPEDIKPTKEKELFPANKTTSSVPELPSPSPQKEAVATPTVQAQPEKPAPKDHSLLPQTSPSSMDDDNSEEHSTESLTVSPEQPNSPRPSTTAPPNPKKDNFFQSPAPPEEDPRLLPSPEEDDYRKNLMAALEAHVDKTLHGIVERTPTRNHQPLKAPDDITCEIDQYLGD